MFCPGYSAEELSTYVQVSGAMMGAKSTVFNVLEAETKLLSLVMIAVGPPSHRRGASYYVPTLFPG